jgi:enamine deaminase RidA (YjgF/YER057c/UK114 family)
VRIRFSSSNLPPSILRFSLSNLAIKINAKLASSVFGQTRAWTTSFDVDGRPYSGLPWVSEVPTLVIGLTTSSGIGQNALSIISGSVGLDPGLMQMGQDVRTQAKNEMINPSVLKSIVKTLTIHFYQHTGHKPKVGSPH